MSCVVSSTGLFWDEAAHHGGSPGSQEGEGGGEDRSHSSL